MVLAYRFFMPKAGTLHLIMAYWKASSGIVRALYCKFSMANSFKADCVKTRPSISSLG